MLNESIKDAEVKLITVDERNNTVIDPIIENEGEVGELPFLRPAQVSQVAEENQLFAYGPVQLDCNCTTGKRIDFQECEQIEGRDVSSIPSKKRTI